MDNKYVLVVMAAIMGVITYYLAHMPFFGGGMEGASDSFWYAAILAVGLGAGSTGGSDAVSILMEGITGYISTMINLAIFGAVIHLVINMGLMAAEFNGAALVTSIATYAVAGLMTNLTLSYLKKAN